jgi:hypothetical protein
MRVILLYNITNLLGFLLASVRTKHDNSTLLRGRRKDRVYQQIADSAAIRTNAREETQQDITCQQTGSRPKHSYEHKSAIAVARDSDFIGVRFIELHRLQCRSPHQSP